MADYFALLSRAVAALGESTPETRDALYERARAVLDGQLRTADPPWSEDRIAGELATLDAAAARIESGFQHAPKAAVAPKAAAVRPPRATIGRPASPAIATSLSKVKSSPRPYSPVLMSAFGAIVLAIIAAGGFAYFSRPTAKAPATGRSTASAPPPNQQPANTQQANRNAPAGPAAKAEKAEKPGDDASAALPYGMGRQFVYYRSPYPFGTIVISTSQHKLYQVKAETVAIQYSIGIGGSCRDAVGLHHVLGKQEWPPWPPATSGSPPPAQTASADPGQHRAESRLGARELALSDIEYGIHGTDRPNLIGQNSAFGCFILTDDDVADLYDRTPVDTRVVITN